MLKRALPAAVLLAQSACSHHADRAIPAEPLGDGDAALSDAGHDFDASDADADATAKDAGDASGDLTPIACKDPSACQWLTLAAFDDQTCAVREDQTLWCWGHGVDTPSHLELRATRIQSLSGSSYGLCLLADRGDLWCLDEARLAPIGDVVMRQVAAASGQGCAVLEDGAVSCWQADSSAFPLRAPDGTKVAGTEHMAARAVATANERACAIDGEQRLWCWASASMSAGGDPLRHVPFQLDPGQTAQRITMSAMATCVIRGDGALLCWNADYGADPWLASSDPPPVPHPVAAGTAFKEVALSDTHACAVAADGSLWCWGQGSHGQLGNGSLADSTKPVRVGSANDWVQVSLAANHSCALNDAKEIWCWGDDSSAQLGFPPMPFASAPRRLAPDLTFSQLSQQAAGGCAVTAGGQLWCWGNHSIDGLPDGTQATPSRIGTDTDWTGVWLAPSFGCGLRAGGQLWCWGENTANVLSDSSTDGVLSAPVAVQPSARYASVIPADVQGVVTLCGLSASGALTCWGDNSFLAFGATDPQTSTSPVPVWSSYAFRSVALSTDSFGVDTAGTLWRLSVSSSAPEQAGQSYTKVVGAWSHQCGLQSDGAICCRGGNIYGELGTPARASTTTFEAMDGAQQWLDVVVRGNSTCALAGDHTLWCWGNLFGVDGTGSEDARSPEQLFPDHQWQSVALSDDGACGLDQTGALYCWGHIESGTLGPSASLSSTPVKVPLP